MKTIIAILVMVSTAAFAGDTETDRVDAIIRELEAKAARLSTPQSAKDKDLASQLLQLRIETAYPNNPVLWQALNQNPDQIPRYLGEER